MSQSKLRGTFEQRKSQSIARKEKERVEYIEARRLQRIEEVEAEHIRRENMTPDELKAESDRKLKAAYFMAVAQGLVPNAFLFRKHFR